MTIYSIIAIIMTLTVMVAYINHRFVKLHPTIGIMSGSLIISLLFILAGKFGFHGLEKQLSGILEMVDFRHLLLDGMLSFLLFAGALNVDINDLKNAKWEIGVLASLSTIASAFLIGTLMYFVLPMINGKLPYLYCLIFGALISPTDPIAVLATFKRIGAPRKLNVTVTGESLFNDGVGIVLFLTLYHLTFLGEPITFKNVVLLFFRQALGGVTYGAVLGLLAYWLLKPVKEHKIEILVTLAIVTGGYALAEVLDVSGPLAMVVAGIFVGNHGTIFNMREKSREALDNFWELIDEVLNAVLFLLIGFELLIIPTKPSHLIAGIVAIPLVLAMRFITVAAPMELFKRKYKYPRFFSSILVWGGLRGGLAVALALSIPNGPKRDLILTMTYAVVAFAVIVQGLTVKPLVRKSKQLSQS